MTNIRIEIDADEVMRRLDPANVERAITAAGDSAAVHLEGQVKRTITAL